MGQRGEEVAIKKVFTFSLIMLFGLVGLAYGQSPKDEQKAITEHKKLDEKKVTSNLTPKTAPNSEKEKVYQLNEVVLVRYMSYFVYGGFWHNEIQHYKPDAKFLVIHIGIINNDNQPRGIPPFYLIDENDNEYGQSSKSILFYNSINMMESLNPNIIKLGYLVFDVPKDRKFKLKVSGGYCSLENAYVELKDISPSYEAYIKKQEEEKEKAEKKKGGEKEKDNQIVMGQR